MDEPLQNEVTAVKSSEIRKSIDDFLATVYPYAKDPDERVRMYIHRVDKVRIPFGSIDAMYNLNAGTCRSHFQNSLAATAFKPIPREIIDKIHEITNNIINSQPYEISFQMHTIVPQVLRELDRQHISYDEYYLYRLKQTVWNDVHRGCEQHIRALQKNGYPIDMSRIRKYKYRERVKEQIRKDFGVSEESESTGDQQQSDQKD